MINIFNRRELAITFSMKEQADIRETLSNNNIEYSINTINRKSPSPASAGSRTMGTFGENLDIEYEYIIYVKRNDYEEAKHLIGK